MISLHWSGHSWNEAPSVSCFLILGKVSPRKIMNTALKIAKNTQLLIDQPSVKLTLGISRVYKMPWRQTFQLCSWELPLSYSASWVRPNTEPHGWGWVHPFTLLDFIALETPTRVDNSVKVLPGFLPQSLGDGRVHRLMSNWSFEVCRFSSNLVTRFFPSAQNG